MAERKMKKKKKDDWRKCWKIERNEQIKRWIEKVKKNIVERINEWKRNSRKKRRHTRNN